MSSVLKNRYSTRQIGEKGRYTIKTGSAYDYRYISITCELFQRSIKKVMNIAILLTFSFMGQMIAQSGDVD